MKEDDCRHCGRHIWLVARGKHFKWKDVGGRWKCPGDPNRPVRSHEPREEKK